MTKAQAIDERDGALHLLHDLRGRLRGRDTDMLRFLQTALDGLNADPPYLPVARERVQACIDMLKTGVK